MQLIQCPVEGCLQPEMWDSTFEINKHNAAYHDDPMQDTPSMNPDFEPIWAEYYPDGTFEQEFAEIFQETFDLLVARQRKYGKSNIETQGLLGVFTRMNNDKMARIKRTLNGRVVNGEIVLDPVENGTEEGDTFEDALKDVANYSLIMLALWRNVWGRPLAEELDD